MLSSLILCNNKSFLNRRVTWDEGGFYTTGDDQLNGWTKKLQNTSQSQTFTTKWSWSLFGLLPVWFPTAFWIPLKSLDLRRMLSKLMRCTKNCKASSWYQSTVQSFSRVQLFAIPWAAASPGFPVHHQLLEFTQTHVHWVGDAIQPSHPLSSPSPPAFSLSQHQLWP